MFFFSDVLKKKFNYENVFLINSKTHFHHSELFFFFFTSVYLVLRNLSQIGCPLVYSRMDSDQIEAPSVSGDGYKCKERTLRIKSMSCTKSSLIKPEE